MAITATIEETATGTISTFTTTCESYAAGYTAIQRTLPENTRLLNIRVDR